MPKRTIRGATAVSMLCLADMFDHLVKLAEAALLPDDFRLFLETAHDQLAQDLELKCSSEPEVKS